MRLLCRMRGLLRGSGDGSSSAAAEVSSRLDIPTIGIGAGVKAGRVLVCNDLLGFDSSFKPRFVKRYAELETPMVDAVAAYAKGPRWRVSPPKNTPFTASGAESRKIY